MPKTSKDYDYIASKISSLRGSYAFLKERTDAFAFSALCIKAHFYRNPALSFTDSELEDMIVDGAYDGGVDMLLADPSSVNSDIIIGQSKFHKNIKYEDVLNALIKMANFYKDMAGGNFEKVNSHTQKRFLTLSSDLGDESKIIFVFCTSAPKNKISIRSLENKFLELFADTSNIELCVLFASDIVAELREAESRRPTVESGEINIDREGNILTYGGGISDAIIVNASAMSFKRLYAKHGNNLLAKNLRYHIKSGGSIRNIDRDIDSTINTAPEMFWMKNNGITVICDSFSVDGKRINLTNFSIINGGQTVYVLHRNKKLNEHNDFWLPCKIILVKGNEEDDKNSYILEIAKAVNSQKPIRDIDLKANSPEQVRFVQAMRDAGIFYQTKRGETLPKEYKAPHLNTDLAETGKLCLCAIFQMPGTSRNKPSSIYQPQYYDVIFKGDQMHTAKICRELLYIDDYFRKTFIVKYEEENTSSPIAKELMPLARNARTTCIAFAAFASRYWQGNITEQTVMYMANAKMTDSASSELYNSVKNIDGVEFILPVSLSSHKDKYNSVLDKLFSLIISLGCTTYKAAHSYDPTLSASNFLKSDKNYYNILSVQWPQIKSEIKKIFDDINK